jgi:SAM-dependent methyltransferase
MHPWQQFFDRFAPRYDDQVFTRNTEAEIKFILSHASPPPHGTILDLGCGTGRHAVPLATRGFRVTGVDISDGMLRIAADRARRANARVEFIRDDACTFIRPNAFDTAICLCEGAFCLLREGDDPIRHDATILRNIHASLKPGGTLILNALSALRTIRAATDADIAEGRFDPMTMTERSDVRSLAPDMPITASLRERSYTAPELHLLADQAGLRVGGVYGGTAGNWGLRPVTLDDYELMVIARK